MSLNDECTSCGAEGQVGDSGLCDQCSIKAEVARLEYASEMHLGHSRKLQAELDALSAFDAEFPTEQSPAVQKAMARFWVKLGDENAIRLRAELRERAEALDNMTALHEWSEGARGKCLLTVTELQQTLGLADATSRLIASERDEARAERDEARAELKAITDALPCDDQDPEDVVRDLVRGCDAGEKLEAEVARLREERDEAIASKESYRAQASEAIEQLHGVPHLKGSLESVRQGMHLAMDKLEKARTERDALRAVLRDVRALANDRQAFVMQGPRLFVKAVQMIDAALGKDGE